MSNDTLGWPEEAPGIVSSDGKHLFIPAGWNINVYDAQTGRRTQRLTGHTDGITGLALHPSNTFQVFSASRDGTVRLWDFADGFIAKQIDTEKPVVALVVPHRQDQVLVQNESDTGSGSLTRRLDLSNWKMSPETLKAKSYAPITAGEDGELVAMADTRRVLVWPTKKGWKTPLRLYHTKNFTCVALDSAEGRVAGGDVSGRILIWHGVREGLADLAAGKEPNMACTTLHWHSQAVQCLTFSLDASYLLSGGSEAVLVAWQLGTNAKRMLPRLSGGLTGICVSKADAATYLVSQRDNTFRRINLASMKVELSISGVKPGPKLLPDQAINRPVVAMLPIGGELVIAGEHALIQFYDPVKDRHLDKLQVKPVNVFSSPDVHGAGTDWSNIEPQVTQMAFSADGAILATIDVRADSSTGHSYTSSLKFWKRRPTGVSSSKEPLYSIHTQLDNPHRSQVSGLAFHPSEALVATVGKDGQLLLWQPMNVSEKIKQWQCTDKLSYQGLPMASVAFSADGSMIAAGCGPIVALWNVKTGELIDTLDAPAADVKSVPHLTFVPGTPYLAGGVSGKNHDRLVVWNLLLKAVWWSSQVSVACLAADGLGTGLLAVGIKPYGGYQPKTATGFAALFNCASPKPVQVWCIPRAWATALFFPEPSSLLFTVSQDIVPPGTNPLLIFTNERKFTIATKPGAKPLDPALDDDVEMQDATSAPGMHALTALAELPQDESAQQARGADIQRLDTRARVANLFDVPTHVLPSIESLAPTFLELLVCDANSADR